MSVSVLWSKNSTLSWCKWWSSQNKKFNSPKRKLSSVKIAHSHFFILVLLGISKVVVLLKLIIFCVEITFYFFLNVLVAKVRAFYLKSHRELKRRMISSLVKRSPRVNLLLFVWDCLFEDCPLV